MKRKVYDHLKALFEDERRQLHEENTAVNMCSLQHLGYALDCMEFADENFGIELDVSEDSLGLIEEMMLAVNESYENDDLSLEHVDKFAEMFSGFVGLIILTYLGGEWVYTYEDGKEYSVIDIDSNQIFLFDQIKACLIAGEEYSIAAFYDEIKQLMDK